MESSEKILTMLQRIEVSLELMEKRIDQFEKNTVQPLPVPNGRPEPVCSPPSKKAFGYGKSSRYALIETAGGAPCAQYHSRYLFDPLNQDAFLCGDASILHFHLNSDE